jgi:deazaflavin-dependent oxidoreductase (nitroreductase family)
MMLQLLKRVNAVLMPIASRGIIGVWAVIHTTGRKSGKPYATPIAVEPLGDAFIIGLPYGEGVDWCRNVMAAGRATITWHGKDHQVTAPEIIDRDAADPAFPQPLRAAVRIFGIKRFLRVTRAA